jgi:hypothetical protein
VDIGALVESLCEDRREAGEAVALHGAPRAPYRADPQALRRCLDNAPGGGLIAELRLPRC